MFGIGLPELIVIFAVALIVVGPDKLPGLARSLAKGLAEVKKAMEQAKESLAMENDVLNSTHKELKDSIEDLRKKMVETDPEVWRRVTDPSRQDEEELIEMEVSRESSSAQSSPSEESTPEADAPPVLNPASPASSEVTETEQDNTSAIKKHHV